MVLVWKCSEVPCIPCPLTAHHVQPQSQYNTDSCERQIYSRQTQTARIAGACIQQSAAFVWNLTPTGRPSSEQRVKQVHSKAAGSAPPTTARPSDAAARAAPGNGGCICRFPTGRAQFLTKKGRWTRPLSFFSRKAEAGLRGLPPVGCSTRYPRHCCNRRSATSMLIAASSRKVEGESNWR